MTDEEIEKLADDWCKLDKNLSRHFHYATFGGHKIAHHNSEEAFLAGFRACQEFMEHEKIDQYVEGICDGVDWEREEKAKLEAEAPDVEGEGSNEG